MHTWIVTLRGNEEVEVTAHTVSIDYGCLYFSRRGKIIKSYPAGGWSMVTMKVEDNDT